MLAGLILVVIAFAVRSGTLNRHIRRRATTSAILFTVYAIMAIALERMSLDPDLVRQGHVLAPLLVVFGSINLAVTLAINPWRADRLPDRFPNIVQDAITIGLFAVVAMVAIPRDLLATTAAGALIVGFALQDTLGNLFAGLAIQIDPPLRVGHWVCIDGRDGLVTEITWRATKMRTKSGNLIVVPNNVLAKETITNYSEPVPQFRVEVEVGASYDTPPNEVKATIRAALDDEPLIDHSRAVEVLIADFAASAITYRARVWATDFGTDEPLRDRMRSQIYYAFRRRGIAIPYPMQVQRVEEVPAAQPPSASGAALKATALFATLTDDDVAQLAGAARALLFAAGETVVKEGDTGSSMFVVQQGDAEVRLAGSEAAVAQLRAGDYFGEMSLLTGQPRSATVVAVSDCLLIEIAVAEFRRVVLGDSTILDRITEAVARRRAELEQHRATISTAREPESPRTLLTRVRRFLGLSAT